MVTKSFCQRLRFSIYKSRSSDIILYPSTMKVLAVIAAALISGVLAGPVPNPKAGPGIHTPVSQ